MSHDTRKCRVKKHGSGSEIRRRTVQRETNGTGNGADPVKITPQVAQRAGCAGHGQPGEDLSTGAG